MKTIQFHSTKELFDWLTNNSKQFRVASFSIKENWVTYVDKVI